MSNPDVNFRVNVGYIQIESEISRDLADRLQKAVVKTGLTEGEIFALAFDREAEEHIDPAVETLDDDAPADDWERHQQARDEWVRRVLSRGVEIALGEEESEANEHRVDEVLR